jgi:glycosyltransferase involved in cell wall biosynthesis
MKIIINVSSIYKGGAEQVANSFINECKGIPGNEYHIFLCENIKEQLNMESFSDNFCFYELDKRPGSGLINLVKTLRYFNQLEKELSPDFVISTGGHGYWRPDAPLVSGFNIPHYIYPESPYFDKINLKTKVIWALKKWIHLYFHRKSDAIIVQTDDVKYRLGKLIPDVPIHTVSNTINGTFLDQKKYSNKLPVRTEGEVRLLTVSANYSHKNIDIIKPVLDQLFSRGVYHVKFVLTLPHDVFKQFISNKYSEHIMNVGPVPIDEVPSLYNECDVMFLPTLLECFSASYAEAMAMEKPILTSDLGFAHTVCGDAALYFDPVNSKDIAEKIIYLKDHPNVREQLIEEGLQLLKSLNTPRERAEKFIDIGMELAAKNR